MKTRRLIALLLVSLMLVGVLAACQDDGDTGSTSNTGDTGNTTDTGTQSPPPPPPAGEIPEQSPQTFIVAYNGEMNGDFIEGFGNNAYDLSIKTLLHHYYATYSVTTAGEFVVNPMVTKDVKTALDSAGNKTYTFTLHDDLKWSDGSPITAEDFVTGILWQASPAWREAGATSSSGHGLLGYSAYTNGDAAAFSGVKLLGVHEFSLTIDAEELPYFYEVNYVTYGPMCKAVYAPGVSIVSDAAGARFSGDILADCQRIASSERFAPTVVSGPYVFLSFDNQICTLQKNPNFKGDQNGNKPTIEYIVQMTVPEATDVDMLSAGEIDLLPANIEGDKIERTKADPGLYTTSYLRNGYGVLHMVCDWGPTQDVNVRWAIACLVDRTQLLDQVLGGYGGLVDTEVGEAQWMYQQKKADLQDKLIPIALNLARANAYLDESDWRFESDGRTPFDSSKANPEGTYMRHNSARQVLTINHAAASAAVGAILEIEFLKNTPLVGMVYNFGQYDFNLILDQFYDGSTMPPDERIFSTYSMGTGFTAVYDPYYSWHSDWVNTHYNPTGLADDELDRLIMAMRRVDPTNKAQYVSLWFDYQIRWNQLLPSVPLYSNEYFNLISNRVQGVNTTPFLDWYEIICDITKE